MIRRAPAAVVSAQDDVGVEELEQPAEVAVAAGGDEGVDDLAVGGRGVAVGSLHAAAGPGGELTGRGRRAVDDRGDVLEGHREDVVEDEREALGGLQRLEHDEQRGSHGVGGQGLALRVGAVSSGWAITGSGRRPLSSASSRRRLRESSIVRHTRETTVVSQPPMLSTSLGVGALDPQPGLLERVVGLGP